MGRFFLLSPISPPKFPFQFCNCRFDFLGGVKLEGAGFAFPRREGKWPTTGGVVKNRSHEATNTRQNEKRAFQPRCERTREPRNNSVNNENHPRGSDHLLRPRRACRGGACRRAHGGIERAGHHPRHRGRQPGVRGALEDGGGLRRHPPELHERLDHRFLFVPRFRVRLRGVLRRHRKHVRLRKRQVRWM